jgi:hypothetical protein
MLGDNLIVDGSSFYNGLLPLLYAWQMVYSIDCLQSAAPEALEVLCDAVLNPLLLEADVAEQRARLEHLLTRGGDEQAAVMLPEVRLRARMWTPCSAWQPRTPCRAATDRRAPGMWCRVQGP